MVTIWTVPIIARYGHCTAHGRHPDPQLLNHEIRHAEGAMAHELHPAVHQVLHHRRHGARRGCSRGTAVGCHPGACLLCPGTTFDCLCVNNFPAAEGGHLAHQLWCCYLGHLFSHCHYGYGCCSKNTISHRLLLSLMHPYKCYAVFIMYLITLSMSGG